MLTRLIEDLRAGLIRPLNCAIIGASLSLTDFIGCPAEQINQINIDPPAWDEICDPQDLEIYPTGWADLIIVDVAVFADIQRDRLWSEMVRIAVGQGLMLALLPESRELSMIHSSLEMVQGALAPYVQSYGTVPWLEGQHCVHWALRNTRNINSVVLLPNERDLHAKGANDLINQTSEPHHSLKQSSLVEPLPEKEAGHSEQGLASTEPVPLNADFDEQEASICRLQQLLDQRTEACRLAEVELDSLQHRYKELWEMLVVGGRPEKQGTISEEAIAQIAALRQELSEMTASYVEMRDTVFALTTSRFWRVTWLPRRLLDRLRACLPSANAVERPIPADHAQITPQPAISFAGSEPSGHQPIVVHEDSLTWKTLWTGSFLNAQDNSTAISKYRLDRILFVDWRLPEPDQDSGSCRIFAILEMAVLLGYRVDFISDADSQEERYRDLLLSLGIHVITGRSRALRHLQRFGFHYRKCFVSRPEPASFYFPLIRCFCPEAELIYDTVDLHYSRFYRGSQLSSHDEGMRLELLNLHYHYKSAEFFLAKSADRVVVVTETEKSQLSDVVPQESIVVLPNVHPVPDLCSLPALEARQDILFVGGFDHAPNVDAVLYFCEHILPLVVAELPDVVFHVVGSNMPEHILNLRSSHINPVGYVADLREVFDRVRVFVAPLRYGAGLKGKVGQSMSFGVPVVGTSIAFEGFSLIDHQEGIIANDPNSFAQSVVKLFVDSDLWLSISTQAWQVIEQRFSTQAVRQCVQSLLQTSSI